MTHVLAVDLGGTSLRVARTSATGEVVDRVEQATSDDPAALLGWMRDVGGAGPVAHAVVGVPGRVDHDHGRLEYARNLDDDAGLAGAGAWHRAFRPEPPARP